MITKNAEIGYRHFKMFSKPQGQKSSDFYASFLTYSRNSRLLKSRSPGVDGATLGKHFYMSLYWTNISKTFF
jgi:hypothetical protein